MPGPHSGIPVSMTEMGLGWPECRDAAGRQEGLAGRDVLLGLAGSKRALAALQVGDCLNGTPLVCRGSVSFSPRVGVSCVAPSHSASQGCCLADLSLVSMLVSSLRALFLPCQSVVLWCQLVPFVPSIICPLHSLHPFCPLPPLPIPIPSIFSVPSIPS